MSTATLARPSSELATAAPAAALEIEEAFAAAPSALRDDKTVLIHIIRPGLGLGRGRHYYSPEMLQENAAKFSDWNVYVDHLSPEARVALGGLPRSLRDIGGWVEESWWDPSIPPGENPLGGMYEKGGVVGRLKPIREIRELLEEGAHSRLKFSIRAKATDASPMFYEGAQAWAVEGICGDPPGSVDCVTEAGAGGRIVEVIEGLSEDSLAEDERLLLEARFDLAEGKLSGGERDKLPDSAFAISESRSYPIHDESHARNALTRVAQHGTPDEKKRVRAAVKRRYPKIDIQETPDGPLAGEGGDSVKDLEEALRDPESPVARAVTELVEARVDEVRSQERESAEEQIEEARQQAREEGKAEAKAESDREVELRDMRDKARELIEAAELPEKLTDKLRGEYALDEDDKPSAKLDLRATTNGDGEVKEKAIDLLEAAVKEEIEEARALVADLNPTAVTGQGQSSPEPGGEREKRPAVTASRGGDKPFWKEHLEESGIDVGEAFELGDEAAAQAEAEREAA